MRLATHSKHRPPFAGICQKLRDAIESDKINGTDPARKAIARVFDSLDLVVFVMVFEELGVDPNLDIRDARTLLAHLEQLDQKYATAHKITLEKHDKGSDTQD